MSWVQKGVFVECDNTRVGFFNTGVFRVYATTRVLRIWEGQLFLLAMLSDCLDWVSSNRAAACAISVTKWKDWRPADFFGREQYLLFGLPSNGARRHCIVEQITDELALQSGGAAGSMVDRCSLSREHDCFVALLRKLLRAAPIFAITSMMTGFHYI